MFTVAFRRLNYIGDKVVVRSLRSRRTPSGANPGLQKRIDVFENEGFKVEDDDAEEFVEQSESDFYKVGGAYKAHLTESVAGKIELRHRIVKDKYFKENMPNLLTWSEKEQIRHLAQAEPDEWTPEKIAESFPVTLPVVKKLLKYPWKPATKERIARHDASAMRNWKELKEGSLDIPEDVRKHFLKFSERTIPPLSQKSVKIDLTQETKLGEFESIIRRCAAKEGQTEENHNQENTTNDTGLIESHTTHARKDFKRVTLDGLADKIKRRLDKGKDIDINDSIMVNSVTSSTDNSVQITRELSKEIELDNEEHKSEITQFKNETQVEMMNYDYMKRIRIPKKAFKTGATYKVNDCYYDDDGKFLYRVLGMTDNK